MNTPQIAVCIVQHFICLAGSVDAVQRDRILYKYTSLQVVPNGISFVPRLCGYEATMVYELG